MELELILFHYYSKVNFLEYLEVVDESIESRSPKCNSVIIQSIADLEHLLDDSMRWAELEGMY